MKIHKNNIREGCYEVLQQFFKSDGSVHARVLFDLNTNDFIAEVQYSDGRIECSLHLLQQCASKVCEDIIKKK